MLRCERLTNAAMNVCLAACLTVALLLGLTSTPLLAQQSDTTSLNAVEQVIDRARKQGVRVIVVDPQNLTKPKQGESSAALIERLKSDALAARQRLFEILANLPNFPRHLHAAILRLSPDKHLGWPIVTAAFTILFLLIAWLPRYFFNRWTDRALLAQFRNEPESASERLGYLFARGATGLIGLAIQIIGAVLLILAFDMGRDHLRYTALIIVTYWALVAGYAVYMRALLAIDVPQHRTLTISNEDASSFYKDTVCLFAIGLLSIQLCVWMAMLGIEGGAHTLSQVVTALLIAIGLIAVAVRHRRSVGHMLFGARPEFAWSLWQRMTAKLWHVPVIAYVIAAWSTMTVRLLLDHPNSIGLVGIPIVIVMLAVGLYGAYLLSLDLYFASRTTQAAKAGDVDDKDEDGSDEAETRPETSSAMLGSAVPGCPYKNLFERVGAYIAVLGVIVAIAMQWGVRPLTEGGWTDAVLDILAVGLIAYVAWSAAKIAIDRKIAESGGYVAAAPGEVGGAGASRLGTLLPLFSNFLLMVIVTVAFMIILTELGVNVTPLFAGAGIVGLAIGFGAQTLVRDILSGVFFLIDDAFRQGEYIDVGDVKGTVESISLRSMQLRHHLGPLNTIPFGEIKNVKNFSRDWVIMKLPLRLTFDTDPEKVRKLINNYGKELLKDEQIGATFLQPLKSQGVIQMDESAMIMRVKFMTKPGDQWLTRRRVLNGIRDLFEKNGIRFAHHEVTVRVSGGAGAQANADTPQTAAGAAAQKIVTQRRSEEKEALGDDF